MSGYESCSPEEGPADMDCYGQQYFCNTRPHFREIHCQNGLASPAEHLGLSEEDISPQQYWPHSRVGSPQSYGNHAHGFMHHQHGGYNGYGYEESHHMSDGQYFQYTNASLSHSAPALSMDCETQQHTTLHQNGSGKMSSVCAPIVRVVKRRNTANKKERRRTQSINTAFADLRDCIPNVPCDTKLSKVSAGKRDTRRTDTINCAFSLLRNRIPNVPTDTKLSKIKTLRLATSYISYLMGVLESDLLEPAEGFRAELAGQGRRSNRGQGGAGKKGNNNNNNGETNNCQIKELSPSSQDRRSKGRTGWPQHVWALELKQEQNL